MKRDASPSIVRCWIGFAASPGVSGAALVNTLPLDGRVAKRSLNLEGRSGPGAENLAALLAQRRHARVLSRHEHPTGLRQGVHGRGSLGQPAGGHRSESNGAAILDGRQRDRQADSGSSARSTGTPSWASLETCARMTSGRTCPTSSSAPCTCRIAQRPRSKMVGYRQR